jgi:hypothetical protein
MDTNEKKIYLRANELYKAGKTAEAIKLWSSINQTKKSNIVVEPLIWKLLRTTNLMRLGNSSVLPNTILILLSFLFGRIAFVILLILGELLYFKSYPDIYIFFSRLSSDERIFFLAINHSNIFDFGSILLAGEQYFVGKVLHIQAYFFTGQNAISKENAISSVLFNYSFVISIVLVSFATIGDIYLGWIVSKKLTEWIKKVFSQQEYQLRLIIALVMAFISLSFFHLVFKTFEKAPVLAPPGFTMSTDQGADGGGGAEDSKESRSTKAGNGEKSELKFLKDFTDELSKIPYSLKEREAITAIYNDYIKMMKKYGIKGGDNVDQPSVKEIIELLKSGKISALENNLKKAKALKDYKRLKSENANGGNDEMTVEDKEFSEVLRKSFMSIDKKTMDEYLKTGKELEELYGKGIKDKVFSDGKKEELLKKFKENPQKAQEFAREETNKILENESSLSSQFSGTLSMDISTRINSIINYLETGGDIKVFNKMRIQFLKDYIQPEIRLAFANLINFVIASWNEHQNKYFWQMNRALMMEVVDMNIEAAKAMGVDESLMDLGWFYLVAGYYEKAREVCLKSIEIESTQGAFLENEGSYVNRSNAALASLMLNQGKTAFIEYRFIYQRVMQKKGLYRAKREELFAEYIRETTAALASPSPCKEAYLCRSMFLEDVNDDLALDDLLKYLSLSPEDELLEREAQLKIKLIKSRLEIRKNK